MCCAWNTAGVVIYHQISPKTAVAACVIKCSGCKSEIDVAYRWIEGRKDGDCHPFDLDCPHCWKCNPFSSEAVRSKLDRFRRKCEKWIAPTIAKPGRVSAALRYRILKRDNFRCVDCGAEPVDTSLHIDHRLSINDGGTNEMENLATLCAECNLGKGSSSISRE